MRRVVSAPELPDAIARARSEAQAAFGDGGLILERAIERARHVEVQVFGDRHGNLVHLGERDCSLQRRFQKVIEEAPSPAVDGELRARMGELAVRAARSARYVGAGTVELLLGQDRDGKPELYFLEMNTRLQVEHPVTELITGLDLVALQLQVAEGRPLPLRQDQLQLNGHAIEARLYAEDPARGYLPATGRVHALVLPDPALARFDHALLPGATIGAHYDPMLGKLIAHGADREQARRKLCRALEALRVLGVQTNQAFLRAVLEHEAFVSARAATDFLDISFDASAGSAPDPRDLAAAALLFATRGTSARAGFAAELAGYSNCAGLRVPLRLEHHADVIALELEPDRAGAFRVHIAQDCVLAELVELDGHVARVRIDGALLRVDYAFASEQQLYLHAGTASHGFTDVTHAAVHDGARGAGAGSGRALAPMDGAIVDVPVRVGDAVTRGQTLAVLEAMKLQLKVTADRDGVVSDVHVTSGAQVKARQVLVELA
jgi:geranyl-CoA carboxylase alpha subunit